MRRWLPWVLGFTLLLAMAWMLTPGVPESAPPPTPESPASAAQAPPAAPSAPPAPELAPTPESGRAFGRHVRRLLGEAQRQEQAAAPEAAPAAEHSEAEDTERAIDTGWYPDVVHPVSREGLGEAMRTAIPGMQRCYQGALELDPELEGRVALSFVIAADGDGETARITETSIEQSTLGQPFMEACLLQQVSPLAFEAPADGSLAVTYPVLFATD